MRRTRHFLLLLAVVLLFAQCRRPHNVLSEGQMKAVMKDMLLVDAYTEQQYQPDSVVLLYYESVLDHHGISRATYDSSLVWYGKNAPLLSRVYEELEKELEAYKAEVDTLLADSLHYERIRYEPKETLWGEFQRLILPNRHGYFLYQQSLVELADVQAGDTLEWRSAIYPPLKEGEKLLLQLYLYHEGDSLATKFLHSFPIEEQIIQTHLVIPDSLSDTTLEGEVQLLLMTHPDSIPQLHLMDRISLRLLSKMTPEETLPEEAQEVPETEL